MNRLALSLAALILPATVVAQAQIRPDPRPPRTDDWIVGGAQVRQRPIASPRRPIASQFDSTGLRPMGAVGDTVTIFYFPDGQNLRTMRTSRITARQRFDPPATWRAQCDDVAHPGWLYTLDAPATSNFAVVVPGRHTLPARNPAPPFAKAGAERFFRLWADTVWQRYQERMKPDSEREYAFLWYNFHSDDKDAGWGRTPVIGIRGPEGRNYGVFSVWMRDDHRDSTPNTTATWIVDAWGLPVAQARGNVDIYGTSDSDGDGIDEVVTSAGLIRWTGTDWNFPKVYSDEPCMLRQVMGSQRSR